MDSNREKKKRLKKIKCPGIGWKKKMSPSEKG